MIWLLGLLFLTSCSSQRLLPDAVEQNLTAHTMLLVACAHRLETPGAGDCGKLPPAPVQVRFSASASVTPELLLDIARGVGEVGAAVLPAALGAASIGVTP